MPSETLPQRTGKTRNAILDAFASLLAERGYGCLTIKDILERASVGRTTFYEHFRSKEEVLRSSVERLGEALAAHGKPARQGQDCETLLAFTLPFFRHVGGEHGIYDTIAGRGDFPIFERYMRRMLAGLVLDELRSHGAGLPSAVCEIASQHVAGALLSTVIWWKENRRLYTPEEMNHLFLKMTLSGLAALLAVR